MCLDLEGTKVKEISVVHTMLADLGLIKMDRSWLNLLFRLVFVDQSLDLIWSYSLVVFEDWGRRNQLIERTADLDRNVDFYCSSFPELTTHFDISTYKLGKLQAEVQSQSNSLEFQFAILPKQSETCASLLVEGDLSYILENFEQTIQLLLGHPNACVRDFCDQHNFEVLAHFLPILVEGTHWPSLLLQLCFHPNPDKPFLLVELARVNEDIVQDLFVEFDLQPESVLFNHLSNLLLSLNLPIHLQLNFLLHHEGWKELAEVCQCVVEIKQQFWIVFHLSLFDQLKI